MNGFEISKRINIDSVLGALEHEGVIAPNDRRSFRTTGNTLGASGEHPLEMIARQKWKHQKDGSTSLTLDWLCKWLALQLDVGFVDITQSGLIDAALLPKIGASYAISRQLLPVQLREKKLVIATAEPLLSTEWAPTIESVLPGVTTVPVLANPSVLRDSIQRLYIRPAVESANGVDDKSAMPGGRAIVLRTGTSGASIDFGSLVDIIEIVDTILQMAFDRRASDIHIEPHEDFGDVRIRVDGVLHLIAQLSADKLRSCVSRLKIMGSLDITNSRLPQDGRSKIRTNTGRDVEIRLSSMPTPFGEKLVLRLFNSDALLRNIDDLGFSVDERALWDKMARQPHGLVLVTGPTGAGKTTTLYAALRALASPQINISTVENPVELIDSRFNQLQINPAIGLTFPLGIRTLLRQDPDVIMVGEIRDPESADVAIQAALTGHLVLATVHTNDATSSITRLLDLNVPPFLVKAALVGVVAQRLVRRLCDNCKVPAQVSAANWEFLTTPTRMNRPEKVYEAHGCDKCNGVGFRGRAGIYELLYMIEPIQRLVTPAADAATIRRISLRSGMTPLRVSGAARIRDGITTAQEVLHVVPPELDHM